MTFGMTLAEHFTMAASANMIYFAIKWNLGVRVTIAQRKTLGALDTNWLLNNVKTILVIMIIKLILICLSNLFFNFFIKMKNKKQMVFRFPFFYENGKRMKY